jgi:type 1 glutamine amidotransferase
MTWIKVSIGRVILVSLTFTIFCSFADHNNKSIIKVLLISGKNNHEWQKTSPAFRQILEEKEFFKVDITERPDTLNASVLKNYQVIASNWNAFPESARQWGEVAEKAIVDFVNRGGGFVLFHSASAAHYDWPEYQQMVGATWGKNTHHGQISPFEVKIQITKHPVTKGMSNFVITDELWVEMDQQPGNEVLCSAFAPSSNKGRDRDEPVLICRNQGKGRCFYLVLGHDVAAMQNLGWKTLMQRGTEWAATGKVTIPIPDELRANAK